jgi:ferredoxin
VSGLKILMDRERCVGTGSCVLTEPAVFDQDEDDGRVTLLIEAPGEDLRQSVTEAVGLCPNGAIQLVEN